MFFAFNKLRAALILPCLLATAPAAAQPAPRTLVVTPTAAWGHAETGMILPPRLAGLSRGEIRDTSERELDIAVSYAGEDATATIAIYRTMVPDAAVWFDRTLLLAASPPPGSEFAPPEAMAFARTGETIASGLRASFAGPAGAGSVAIAAVPLGDWLLIIRMQSAQLDPAALDARLTGLLQQLRWPAADAGARAAAPIRPCAQPLRLRDARLVRTEGANVLMDLIGVAVAQSQRAEHPTAPPVYCREPGANAARGVYRPNGSDRAYLIAIDAGGIGLQLGAALDISEAGGGGGGGRVSMMLLGRDSTSALLSFNRLPPPDQALFVARGSRATMSTTVRDPAPR